MATLADNGRIDEDIVGQEITRLQTAWQNADGETGGILRDLIGETRLAEIDAFDRPQLEGVIDACRRSSSLSAAGRELFSVSRLSKKSTNDADRLKKYLAKFGLSWDDL